MYNIDFIIYFVRALRDALSKKKIQQFRNMALREHWTSPALRAVTGLFGSRNPQIPYIILTLFIPCILIK